jgi:hypothetical protein
MTLSNPTPKSLVLRRCTDNASRPKANVEARRLATPQYKARRVIKCLLSLATISFSHYFMIARIVKGRITAGS